MKQLNEYFFIIGFLFILFIIILFRTIRYEKITNPKDPNANKVATSCHTIGKQSDCNNKINCSWGVVFSQEGSRQKCIDLSCNSYNDSKSCDGISKCLWNNSNNSCSINNNKNADKIKPATRLNGRQLDCYRQGYEFKDSKCFLSDCINYIDPSSCNVNYNCLWSQNKGCIKDIFPTECINHWEWNKNQCNNKKCFWNPNKNGPKFKYDGTSGRCDAINPKDWKP
jgi:hypothetical protein